VQANIFNSMCTFMSIVPPALRTGSNFGCSAFLVGLRHLIMEAKITPQQSHVRPPLSLTHPHPIHMHPGPPHWTVPCTQEPPFPSPLGKLFVVPQI